MADSNNMYGANLKEYALDVLHNKQIARSTFINWQGVIRIYLLRIINSRPIQLKSIIWFQRSIQIQELKGQFFKP